MLIPPAALNLNQIVLAQQGSLLHWYWLPLLPFVPCVISSPAWPRPTALQTCGRGRIGDRGGSYGLFCMALRGFFLAEYAKHDPLVSALASTLFLGGWLSPFEGYPGARRIVLRARRAWLVIRFRSCCCFPVVRATFPRYRYDQIMRLGLEGLYPGDAGLVAGD